ncbi:ATP-dependent zinc protease family protein [Marinobacter sp. C2H3]|uniref:ATP-dependent zinc protease family protein n=1 Tax=Marinobacter sp. C2H3 TaxID=3119003 RepID=UPI00300F38E7
MRLTLMHATVLAGALLTLPAGALAAEGAASSQAARDGGKGVPEVLGFVEWAMLEDGRIRMKARMDTGAKTSSLHAENIEEFDRDGDRWVRFQIPLGDHDDVPSDGDLKPEDVVLKFERPVRRTVLIKRKGAEPQRRYVVDMDFCIAGTVHTTQFSLADRSAFSYPMLLGRRFMGKDNILIDSSDSFLAKKECKYLPLGKIVREYKDNVVKPRP